MSPEAHRGGETAARHSLTMLSFDPPAAMRQELREELRELGQQAMATRSEAEHWKAVSIFVVGYAASSRAFASETLSFMNEEHSAWCASIIEVVENNRDEDPVTRGHLYASLIADNAQASGYVEWMVEKTVLDW